MQVKPSFRMPADLEGAGEARKTGLFLLLGCIRRPCFYFSIDLGYQCKALQ